METSPNSQRKTSVKDSYVIIIIMFVLFSLLLMPLPHLPCCFSHLSTHSATNILYIFTAHYIHFSHSHLTRIYILCFLSASTSFFVVLPEEAQRVKRHKQVLLIISNIEASWSIFKFHFLSIMHSCIPSKLTSSPTHPPGSLVILREELKCGSTSLSLPKTLWCLPLLKEQT